MAFTQEVADAICAKLADGMSLREICAADDMPDKSTVLRWLQDDSNAAFRDQYARAREAQADSIFDEILSIADDAQNDWMERNGSGDAGWVANGEHIQRSKLRIDARKWMAGKLRPKVYGDRSVVEGPGPNGEHTVKTEDAGHRDALAHILARQAAAGTADGGAGSTD